MENKKYEVTVRHTPYVNRNAAEFVIVKVNSMTEVEEECFKIWGSSSYSTDGFHGCEIVSWKRISE